MRISQAAKAADVSVPTFKFYIREGLVAPGHRLSQTQASYNEAHVRRVRLARALLETGGLSISQTRSVLATLSDGSPLTDTFAAAQHAISGAPAGPEPSGAAAERVAAFLADQGWNSGPDNPGFRLVAQVLDGLASAGLSDLDAFLSAYGDAADAIARADLAALQTRTTSDEVAELMVVGTILGDRLLAGLRRMAQQHHSTGSTYTAAGHAFVLPDLAHHPDPHTQKES